PGVPPVSGVGPLAVVGLRLPTVAALASTLAHRMPFVEPIAVLALLPHVTLRGRNGGVVESWPIQDPSFRRIVTAECSQLFRLAFSDALSCVMKRSWEAARVPRRRRNLGAQRLRTVK